MTKLSWCKNNPLRYGVKRKINFKVYIYNESKFSQCAWDLEKVKSCFLVYLTFV